MLSRTSWALAQISCFQPYGCILLNLMQWVCVKANQVFDLLWLQWRLNWFRHVLRTGSERLPAKALHFIILYQWEKKPRKTTKEMDGQCKWRYGSKEVDCTTSNGSGVGQKQTETSSSSLIIIEMMEESRRRRRRCTVIDLDKKSICNRFHARWANSGKITISKGVGVPLFDALIRGESLHPVAPNYLVTN